MLIIHHYAYQTSGLFSRLFSHSACLWMNKLNFLKTYVSCLRSSTSPSKLLSVGPLMVIIGWRRKILGDSRWWWYWSREEYRGWPWWGFLPPWRGRWWWNWEDSLWWPLLLVFLKFWVRLSWISMGSFKSVLRTINKAYYKSFKHSLYLMRGLIKIVSYKKETRNLQGKYEDNNCEN